MSAVAFPQRGGCVCGDVRFRLNEDPLTLYVCHCTDCQTQSGASFGLTLIARAEALEVERGAPEASSVELADGRVKRSNVCPRCHARLWGPSSGGAGLVVVEPGTFDDTSWLQPVAHIWTRSAQPWLPIPADALQYPEQPDESDYLDMVRAWKQRAPA